MPVLLLRLFAALPWLLPGIIQCNPHPAMMNGINEGTDDYDQSAAWVAAIFRLNEKGVENVLICSVFRIEAPLSGYLVDATGNLEIEGVEYTSFRVGVRDDGEDPSLAGTEFVFLAAGSGDSGESWIYPPEASCEDSNGCFVPEHEFLRIPFPLGR